MKIIQKVNNPKFLVITPLKIGDKISKKTKISIKRNNHSFDWISFEGNNNIPTNTQLGLFEYEKKYKKVDFLIKIDNDINMDRGLLDELYETLIKSNENIGYTYCKFTYNMSNKKTLTFNQEFDKLKLLESNYISSNSMIKRKILDEIGGFVIDQQYERLLDWALWIKFLSYGYQGKLVVNKSFTTELNDGNISLRGAEDYRIKYKRVVEDFVNPYKNEILNNVK